MTPKEKTTAKRRRIARLRSCLYDGKPWSIMPSSLSSIAEAINSRDLALIKSSMSFGRDAEATFKIVNGIAVIPITGVLRDEADWMVRCGYASSYQLIERDLKQAIDNPSVKGVLFYCDTPGGSAVGCKRVADTVFELRNTKPIHAYTQGMCGSAGFYIMAACTSSSATADSLVGSIGTIYPHVEQAKMFEEWGIGATVITNVDSPKKGHGNVYEPLNAESKKTLQGFVDSYGRGFIEDVARYRGITADDVIANYGQGDAFRADVAIKRGMIDAVVSNFQESLESISGVSSSSASAEEHDEDRTPVVTGQTQRKELVMKVSKKVRAQLFVCGLIQDMDCSDEICNAAMAGWFGANGGSVPSDEAAIMQGLQAKAANVAADVKTPASPQSEATATDPKASQPAVVPPASNVQKAHENEMGEARLADLKAAASLVNEAAGYVAVTAEMVLASFEKKLDAKGAMVEWNKTIAEKEPAMGTSRVNVTGQGADRYAADVIDAMLFRASDNRNMQLSEGAAALVGRPLWAVAGECLQLAGHKVDMYGSRELLAEEAMQMGNATRRQTFFSGNEDRRYVQANGIPFARPGDFPNILSGLANKFLDTIELDNDFSFESVSAMLPGGLNDFKPAMMVNKGVVEEMDELEDSEKFKELGLDEEVLSYIFLRRFGNSFGWTPVLVANDDMNAFAEGMIGLAEAWATTQNRLVVDRYTSNETLLDGSALFADRANTGTGTNPALNNNTITSTGAPSDTTWAAAEVAYADIGGIGTGKRVRGTLNTVFVPTGARAQEARRTFMTLNQGGLEGKMADTTANVGLYRGEVAVIPESELRMASTTTWYALRSPTKLNTATVVRAYFNGFGTQGRRERWYDPTNKTTYVSLEGRIAVAVKNWRYAIRATA